MVQELNKFSDYIISQVEQKNKETLDLIKNAEERLEKLTKEYASASINKMKMVPTAHIKECDFVVPELDIQRVKERISSETSFSKLVEELRSIEKQGIRGGKDYWEALIRLGNDLGWWEVKLGGAEVEKSE